MSFYDSFEGLRLYHWLPLVLWAFPFPDYLVSWSFLGQYFILILSWTCYRHWFSGHSHHCRPLMYSSVKNFLGSIINSLSFGLGAGYHLCMNLASLYLCSFGLQPVLF